MHAGPAGIVAAGFLELDDEPDPPQALAASATARPRPSRAVARPARFGRRGPLATAFP
jgi:hypothetical protein